LIVSGDSWRYFAQKSAPATGWNNTAFTESPDWASGPSQLGYGNDGERTPLPFGSDPANKYITAYFRKSITIPNPAAFQSFTLRYKRDDGIILYLNGVEIRREYMPAGAVGYGTLASQA
ncbi:hypothetical protein, partial [Larkinella soli]|uniref:hypothetical protein n=1 Tax=Larkinella soli TaxID=1770527 RepID=UPI0019CF6F9D